MVLVDLKRVQLRKWRDFPHCVKFVNSAADVVPTLDYCCRLMDARYMTMEQLGIETSDEYRLYIVIDELAQVLLDKHTVPLLTRIGQLARASGMHLICASQDISRTKGVPAQIQQNFSTLLGLRCRSAVESRQIIGVKGCETLPKYGYCYVSDSDGLELIKVPYTDRSMIDDRLAYWQIQDMIRAV